MTVDQIRKELDKAIDDAKRIKHVMTITIRVLSDQYIKNEADNLSKGLNKTPIYKITNPFEKEAEYLQRRYNLLQETVLNLTLKLCEAEEADGQKSSD